jgi:hypothetical protein
MVQGSVADSPSVRAGHRREDGVRRLCATAVLRDLPSRRLREMPPSVRTAPRMCAEASRREIDAALELVRVYCGWSEAAEVFGPRVPIS